MAMPATGRLDGNARVHQREAAAANRGHRRRAVRLERLARRCGWCRGTCRSSGIRRSERALGEGAVTDLASAGAAHGLGLTGREAREVVVEQEALPPLAGERVDLLLVGRGAERGGDDGLRLAALEERRAVHARQEARPRT